MSSVAPERQAAPSTLELSLLGVITFLGAALRLYHLGAKSFWFDEGASVGIARLDWYDFARLLWRREANMSLYYLLLRGWLHFGHTEAFIRGLSVLFAVATVPAIYLLGRRLFSGRAGLIAAGLLSVNSYHLRFSQEARCYPLLVFLCTLSSLYFLESVHGTSRARHAVSGALSVYAHFYAGLLLAAQWISLRLLDREDSRPSKPPAWRWIALLILPVAVFVVTTGAGPLSWLHRPGPKDIWELATFLTGNGGPALVAAYIIACLAAILPVLRTLKRKRVPWEIWRYRFLLLWLLFPPVLILLVSLARPLFLPRYFLFCLPALVLLAASALARLRSPWTAIPALLLFAALSLGGVSSYFRKGRPNDDWRAISSYVLSNSQPGDALLFHIAMARIPYEYYRGEDSPPAAPVVLYPSHGARITYLDFIARPDHSALANELPHYQRVWLVLSHIGKQPATEPTAASLLTLLRASFPESEEREFGDSVVFLFHR